jgi:putative NIF3 family GTP cyclohydrolase 1 type 2
MITRGLRETCNFARAYITRSNFTEAKVKNMGLSVKEIVKTLQSYASLTLAESWDNVGLLVDPMTDNKVKTILLTNDLTEDVVAEAKQLGAGLIVSYHPNIFQGLKRVSAEY